MYRVFPHPGPYPATSKTRIWMKGTVVQSPHSVHPDVNIPVRFVMLDLAKQCWVWDDFKKLTENAEKAAKALTAIVHETKWSFGGMPLQNSKEEFFRKTTSKRWASKRWAARDDMHRPSSLQSSGLGSDKCRACGFQQLKAADDSHPQAADWEFFLIIPLVDSDPACCK
jgi:hypothetical protein